MADFSKETINIGTTANDGSGDTIRVSFRKTNNNFTELYDHSANLSANVANLQTDLETYAGNLLLLGSAAFGHANGAFDLANGLISISQTAIGIANNSANTANAAAINAAAAFAYANSQFTTTILTRNHANAAFTVANAAFGLANTIADLNTDLLIFGDKLNRAYTKANDAYDLIDDVYFFAQGVSLNTTAAFDRANSIYSYLNTAHFKLNAAYTVANSNYVVTNSAFERTNTTFALTQRAFSVANAAFGRANTKLDAANGVASGTLTINGIARVVSPNNNVIEFIDGIIYINGVAWNPTPIGAVIYTASPTVPDGFLFANGAEVSRTTYFNLFNVIGITHGAGNGTTTFNLPDLRGVFIRGLDGGRQFDTGRALGSYQGDGVGPFTLSDPGHRHRVTNFYYASTGYASGGATPLPVQAGGTGNKDTEIISSGITISGTINESRPKNVALIPCIKY